MRLALTVFVFTWTLAASDPQDKKQTPAAPAKIIKPLDIPPGAVEREPGRFYFTDQQGKKWIFSKTPFGIARLEDKPAAADEPKPIDPMANVKVTEEGDIVKFERPGPFGTYKWQKKRSELDEKEKAALGKARDGSLRPEPPQKSPQGSKQD